MLMTTNCPSSTAIHSKQCPPSMCYTDIHVHVQVLYLCYALIVASCDIINLTLISTGTSQPVMSTTSLPVTSSVTTFPTLGNDVHFEVSVQLLYIFVPV